MERLMTRLAPTIAFVAAALASTACQTPSTTREPPVAPTVEQVRALLADAERAAASGDAAAMDRLFADRPRVSDEDRRRFEASRFWTLAPGKRVSRLGPDAFRINPRLRVSLNSIY